MKKIVKNNSSIICWQREAILLTAYCLLLIIPSCKEKTKGESSTRQRQCFLHLQYASAGTRGTSGKLSDLRDEVNRCFQK